MSTSSSCILPMIFVAQRFSKPTAAVQQTAQRCPGQLANDDSESAADVSVVKQIVTVPFEEERFRAASTAVLDRAPCNGIERNRRRRYLVIAKPAIIGTINLSDPPTREHLQRVLYCLV